VIPESDEYPTQLTYISISTDGTETFIHGNRSDECGIKLPYQGPMDEGDMIQVAVEMKKN